MHWLIASLNVKDSFHRTNVRMMKERKGKMREKTARRGIRLGKRELRYVTQCDSQEW